MKKETLQVFQQPPAPESSTGDMTPPLTEDLEPTIVDELWDGRAYSAPWPGNKYIIYEQGSNKAITLTDRGLRMEEALFTGDERHHWLCVEKNGYFGFHNPKRGLYLGHDDAGHVVARASAQKDWELMTPRAHPNGGYQLLLPHWWHTLTVMTIAEDGIGIANRPHGITVWEFMKI